MSNEVNLNRVNLTTGLPEHRHSAKGAWHWAWSTHRDANEADHGGAEVHPDPRTPEQIKAGLGHSPSHLKASGKRAKVEAVSALFSYDEYGDLVVPPELTEGEILQRELEALEQEVRTRQLVASKK